MIDEAYFAVDESSFFPSHEKFFSPRERDPMASIDIRLSRRNIYHLIAADSSWTWTIQSIMLIELTFLQ